MTGTFPTGRPTASASLPDRESLLDDRWCERELRREWWLNHGHDFVAIYGDDGEMQCAQCLGIDYKRTPLPDLYEHVTLLRAERAQREWEKLANG